MLPFESEFSVHVRFAQANIVGVSGVRVGATQSCRWLPSFNRPARTQSPILGTTASGVWPAIQGDSRGALVERYLLSSQLRICPVCWAERYHSYVYQLVFAPVCPVHGCPLVTECLACGADLPGEGVDNLRVHRWYQCRQCGEPVSGASADWLGYVQDADPASLASALVDRLSPLVAWLERISTAPFMKPQLLSQIHAGAFPWEPAAFLHSVAYVRLGGPSSLLQAPAFADITTLRWELEVLPNKLMPDWTFDRRVDRVTRHVMWWKVCRRVEHWAADPPGSTHRNHRDGGAESETVATRLRAAVQASAELRALASSRTPPLVPLERHAGGAPRLALVAYFLGVWATAIWKAFLGQPVNPSNWNPPFLVEESDGVQQGWVLFPSVPGLSISPFNSLEVPLDFPTGHRDRFT